MRLLYLTADPGVPVLGHKGASVHVRELARALADCGVHVVIASPRVEPEGDRIDGRARLRAISPVLPERLDQVADGRAAMDAQAAEVLAIARAEEVDAVYERFSLFSDAGVRAAAALGIPHVLEVNAPLREEARRFRTLPHPALAADVERDVLSRTGRVLVVSEPLVAPLVAAGADARIVEVVPNGVSPDGPVASPGSSRAFTVGFAGSLKPWHGIETLVQAVELAAREVPGLQLEVVGDGPQAGVLAGSALGPRRVRALGALAHGETRVRIAGWDVGAAPYAPLAGFYFSPLKVLEYMAAAVCPVASALGEMPALLGHGDRGVLVAPDDAPALARALVGLARDPGRTARLGAAARAHVLAHRGWDANARRIVAGLAAQSAVGA